MLFLYNLVCASAIILFLSLPGHVVLYDTRYAERSEGAMLSGAFVFVISILLVMATEIRWFG